MVQKRSYKMPIAGSVCLAVIACCLFACSDDSAPHSAGNGNKGLNKTFNTGLLKSIADLIGINPTGYDALLVASIAASARVHNESDPLRIVTKPNAFFYDHSLHSFVPTKDVRCNTAILQYYDDLMPYRYRQAGTWDDEGYDFGDQIDWDFETFEPEWVSTSIDLPSSFHPMSAAVADVVKVSEGVTITWNNPQPDGEVMINLYSRDETGIRGRYILTGIEAPDNGSYTFSTQDLQGYEIYETGELTFHIGRVSYKDLEYANGDKKALVLAFAEANYVVPVQP